MKVRLDEVARVLWCGGLDSTCHYQVGDIILYGAMAEGVKQILLLETQEQIDGIGRSRRLVIRCDPAKMNPVVLREWLALPVNSRKLANEGMGQLWMNRSAVGQFQVPLLHPDRMTALLGLISSSKELIRLREKQLKLQQELLESVVYHEMKGVEAEES